MNRGRGKAKGKNRNNCRSKDLEKVREGGSSTNESWFSMGTRTLVTGQSGDRLPAHTGYRLVDLLWEDERVWLESLALKTHLFIL